MGFLRLYKGEEFRSQKSEARMQKSEVRGQCLPLPYSGSWLLDSLSLHSDSWLLPSVLRHHLTAELLDHLPPVVHYLNCDLFESHGFQSLEPGDDFLPSPGQAEAADQRLIDILFFPWLQIDQMPFVHF